MSAFVRLPRVLLSLYLLVAAANLLGLALGENWSLLHQIAKPLLMPCLIAFVWLERKEIHAFGWIIAALSFSWLGDIFLMNAGPMWFILGLSSFLIAHICYIRRFFMVGNHRDSATIQGLPWREFLIFGAGILLIWQLWPTLGEMQVPVSVYALVITTMSFAAIRRKGKVSFGSYTVVLAGALLFMVSDSLIAFSRFAGPDVTIPWAAIWIMLTYIAAQGLIVWGIRLEKGAFYSTESKDTV